MPILQYYEAIFGVARERWTVRQWQEVAEQLAESIDAKNASKKRGRPPLTRHQKDNIPALAFWARQEKESAARSGRKITQKDAVSLVIKQAAERNPIPGMSTREILKEKLLSAIKQVRTFSAAQKK